MPPPNEVAPPSCVSDERSTERTPEPDPVPATADADTGEAAGVMSAPVLRTREATAADLDHLESLTLDDFAADFSQVQLPQKAEGERLTDAEMQTAVDSFLQTLQGR